MNIKLVNWFRLQWRSNPLFSTAIALLAMIVLQTLALGTDFASFGEWWSSFCVNWINVLRNNASVGIVALGMALVIISGGIDLAVGSTMAMAGAFFLMLTDCSGAGWLAAAHIDGWPAFALALLLALLFGALLGAVNGVLVADGGIPPFIATLGTMKCFRSVTQYFMQGRNPVFPSDFLSFASLRTGGYMVMPILYWAIAGAIVWTISRKTVFGVHVFAVGSNERASRLTGIAVKSVKRWVYTIAGALTALAAVINVCRIGSMDFSNAGSGYEMDAIAAVIVGGTRMSGGRGSIVGTMLGVLIIGVMNNLLNLVGVDPFLREAFKGVIVIVAVLIQRKDTGN